MANVFHLLVFLLVCEKWVLAGGSSEECNNICPPTDCINICLPDVNNEGECKVLNDMVPMIGNMYEQMKFLTYRQLTSEKDKEQYEETLKESLEHIKLLQEENIKMKIEFTDKEQYEETLKESLEHIKLLQEENIKMKIEFTDKEEYEKKLNESLEHIKELQEENIKMKIEFTEMLQKIEERLSDTQTSLYQIENSTETHTRLNNQEKMLLKIEDRLFDTQTSLILENIRISKTQNLVNQIRKSTDERISETQIRINQIENNTDDRISETQNQINQIHNSTNEKISETQNRINQIKNNTDAITSRLTNVAKQNNETHTRLNNQGEMLLKIEDRLNDTQTSLISENIRISETQNLVNQIKKSTDERISETQIQINQIENSTDDRISETQNQINQIHNSTYERISKTQNRINQIKNNTDAITSRLTNVENQNNETHTRLNNQEKMLLKIEDRLFDTQTSLISENIRISETQNLINQIAKSTDERISETQIRINQIENNTDERISETQNRINQIEKSTDKRISETQNQINQIDNSTYERLSKTQNRIYQIKNNTDAITCRLTNVENRNNETHTRLNNQEKMLLKIDDRLNDTQTSLISENIRISETQNLINQIKKSTDERISATQIRIIQIENSTNERISETQNQVNQIEKSTDEMISETQNRINQIKNNTDERISEAQNQINQIQNSTDAITSRLTNVQIENNDTQNRLSIIERKASEFVQEDAMHTEVVPDSEDTPTIATELPNTVQSSTPTEAAETRKASEFVQEDAMHTEVVPDSEDTPTIATELPNTVQSSTPTEAPETTGFIGCSVWLTSPQTVGQETVIFEGITLNEGGHYQPLTGEFLCAVTGAYYAAVTVKADNTGYVFLAITRNGEQIVYIHEYYNTYNTVTNSCVMRCEAGDVITVTGRAGTSSVYGDRSVPYSSFIVMLLYEGDTEQHHAGFDGLTSYKPYQRSYSVGEVITFPGIIYESPNYTPSTSRYICPENGIYFVSVNVLKYSSIDLHIGVEHKSHTVLSVSDSVSGNTYNQVGNSVLLHCAHNETITVKATGAGSVYGSSRKYTTFTIMQIHSEGNPGPNRHASFVGCSLWKRSTQVYSTADTIVYDGIALNFGNHFDSILNRFTCPFNGIYYVTATAKKHSTSDLQVDILHATATLFRLEDLRMSENTVSNSALVRCLTGEAIQVKAAGSGRIFGEKNGAFTTLNIFMIYEY